MYLFIKSVVDQDTTLSSYPIYKTSKPVTQEKWHQRAAHLNYRDLATLPRVTEGVIFLNESNHVDKDESQFCEACTQGKQHKVHNKKPATNRATEARVSPNADLFGGENTLQKVDGYRYRGVVTDDAKRMRFSMTLKSKEAIFKELGTIFNQVKKHTGQYLKYFRSDDARKYQGLQPTFKEKGILWEKSATYA